MPLDKVREYHNRGTLEAVNILMAMHCGPLLKGLKNTVIISVDNKLLSELVRQLESTPYGYLVLNEETEKSLLMLYHIQRFQEYISRRQVISGLRKYGYGVSCKKSKEENMMCALFELAERISEYYQEKREFPHEIGYFLEYPALDVEMFIQHKGQNYLMTGYWKVYHNIERAKEIFAQYDLARERTVEDVIAGKMLYELAV